MSDTDVHDRAMKALAAVLHPVSHKHITEEGMIGDIAISEGRLSLMLKLKTSDRDHRQTLEETCESALIALPGVKSVKIKSEYIAEEHEHGHSHAKEPLLKNVKHVIFVGAGKGGVGKSTVAANIAVALAKTGTTVGLLDADVYGPSIPMMFGVRSESISVRSVEGVNKMIPPEAHGVKLMSIGFIVPPEQAMVWRGPMLHSAIVQFLKDVDWGKLDFLVVDLPPGTGDVSLSLTQSLSVAGAVIVSTPQDVALADVIRAKNMFEMLGVEVLGLIQNMSEFCAPDGKVYRIFAGPPVEDAAKRMGVPALGAIPIDPEVGLSGDGGTPIMADASKKNTPVYQAFEAIAMEMLRQLAKHKESANKGE